MAGLFKKNGRARRIPEKLAQYDDEYLLYCVEKDRVETVLESTLHETDDPKEIIDVTLKTVCEFYGGDWAGVMDIDMDTCLWRPVCWFRAGGATDRTLYRLSGLEDAEVMPRWLESMHSAIRDYVRRHPEFVIVKEYADDGYSGVNFERPGFKQMMEDIKAKKIDCVICKDLSRFARNYIDAGRYLEKIFPFMGVRFIAINDNYDSCGEKAQSDALIVPFKNLINDAYCRDISVKIRSQLDIKRKMGDFIGAFAPYGYRKDEANRNRLVVDEEAARTVELIFRLRIQGLCNSAIADRLNSMGVLSPMEYKQAQGFNYSCGFRSNEQAEWSPMLVKRILSNEIYIGTLIQHKSGTPNHKIKKRVEYDRDEWIVIENNHEPIICRSDFDTVQNLMLRDVRTAPKQEKVHLFSGFVFCGDCKHTMVRKTVPSGGKKYHYLVCSTNKAGKGCSPHTFSEDKLKAIVLRVVNDHIELIAQVEQVLDYIASLPEQERRIINYDAQMTALENEIKRYQDLKINLYSDMADGVISREEYKEFHAGYDRRIADRQRQLGKLKDERSQAMENSSGNIEWIEQFKKYRHLTELDRECIVHLIEKILIYDGKRIEVCFRYRDELENALQYIERFEDVLPAEEGVTIPERRNA